MILLQPTDVLFFRDGRPMEGALAGYGAAWPLPNVVNAAFHAALHRSGLGETAHSHRQGLRGVYAENAKRDRKFGSLKTAGPFPVHIGQGNDASGCWYFPRPLDLLSDRLTPALLPTARFDAAHSSLPDPLEYAVGNLLPPTKETSAKAWLSAKAYERYLEDVDVAIGKSDGVDDGDFCGVEHNLGIAIDPATGTTGSGETEGKIYTAHYLRLREDWRLGVCATAEDKEFKHTEHGNDLIRALLNGGNHQIIVGGQQRVCSAVHIDSRMLPLPRGRTSGFVEQDGQFHVKWVLLSPAVWPVIQEDASRGIIGHPGGWLPNWIQPETGEVLLRTCDSERAEGESREAWRRWIRNAAAIPAKLVAAIVPKPIVVTGWSLPDEALAEKGGAQSAHLAVAAGAVYYFQAESAEAAAALASALNWHGQDAAPKRIKNRRSTLLGEKGFGLGVCGTWRLYGRD